jgi:hypothetical protein
MTLGLFVRNGPLGPFDAVGRIFICQYDPHDVIRRSTRSLL